ncbi:MAG: hypothetical protein VB070_14100 [Clostridiaceae bacterium]|nr:hypothetical protein [Clostridiaceae bacterium]
MNRRRLYTLIISAMLCAIGIIIPMISPIRILIEPASFTLGSHIAIFIGMFVSPVCAIAVAIGTTIGFLLAAFPLTIVLRAASHLIFAICGALILKKRPEILDKAIPMAVFAFLISLMHAVCEILVIIPFYFTNQLKGSFYDMGFLTSVVLVLGVGSLVHSLIDFAIARVVWVPLKNMTRKNLGT